jgi:hypothetical protein
MFDFIFAGADITCIRDVVTSNHGASQTKCQVSSKAFAESIYIYNDVIYGNEQFVSRDAMSKNEMIFSSAYSGFYSLFTQVLLVSVTPAITSKPPTIIDGKIGSPSISAPRLIPNTGTRLLNTAVRAGPMLFTPS